jgi:hypothetical protein
MLTSFEILPPDGRQNDGLYHYENCYSQKTASGEAASEEQFAR